MCDRDAMAAEALVLRQAEDWWNAADMPREEEPDGQEAGEAE